MADKPAASHAHFRAAQQASTHFDKILNTSAAASQMSRSSDSFTCHPSSSSQSQSQPCTLAPSPIRSLFNNNRQSAIESRTMAANFPHSDSSAVAQPAMAAPAPPKAGNRLDISNLMSPPENLLETFNQAKARRQESKTLNEMTSVLATMSANSGRSASVSDKQPLPMSPPISPYTKTVSSNASNGDNTPSTPQSSTIQDPVLYPIDEASPSGLPQPPLFAPAEDEDTHMQIVDDHVRALESTANLFTVVPPPRREDYKLMISIKSQVMKNYNSNPRAWLRKERAYLIADREAALGARRLPLIQPAKPIAAKPARSQRADRVFDRVSSRVSKPHAPRPIRSSGAPTTAAVAAAASSLALASPIAAARSTAGRRRPSATPEPSRRIVAPSREDKNFQVLQDFCPPLSSLSDRAASQLKPDWKGQPIDLSNDPNRKLLHPAELNLASGLRLDCATYLTSKRRMFMRRLERFQNNKEFRKTDAQQACKIDVNKASRLWVVFNNAGWLEPHWMVPFKDVKIESTTR
ncbi:uncharacterized protein TrAFT101_000370 [Trichoderma asperellum]|uniref:uncharacterized protein n=1 Tax=Trichoderma asperellum TaxID=101201 RepID=UPI00331B1A55|nr:hypothetical protein TrAFT101_000370 [Trichoderma asperellum]